MDRRALGLVAALSTIAACSQSGDPNLGDTDVATTGDPSPDTEPTSGTPETDATTTTTTSGSASQTAGTTADPPETSGLTTSEDTTSAGTTSEDPTADPTADPTDPPPACDGSGLGPGDHTITLEHDGVMRSAIVHVPANYDPQAATPVVLNFHGFTSSAQGQVDFSLMNPTADAHNFIVVYGEGRFNAWNAGLCCGLAVSNNVDDVGFVRALVEHLHSELCVDARRIYSVGMSNGGYISHRLACEAADLIAAIGPVSASAVFSPCTPSRPVPVMMFNGTADFLVPYNGGVYPSAPASFAAWADRNGCTDTPTVTHDAGAVTCETHSECTDDAAVTLCTVEGMGHCWPGTDFCPWGSPNTDISANEALWAFLSQFSLP